MIDLSVYKYKVLPREGKKPTFFIVNSWQKIKNPYPMLEAFANMASKRVEFELRIGGYGPILDDMRSFVKHCGLGEYTVFLGKMYNEIGLVCQESDIYTILWMH